MFHVVRARSGLADAGAEEAAMRLRLGLPEPWLLHGCWPLGPVSRYAASLKAVPYSLPTAPTILSVRVDSCVRIYEKINIYI